MARVRGGLAWHGGDGEGSGGGGMRGGREGWGFAAVMGMGVMVMGWGAAVARGAGVLMGWPAVMAGVVGDGLGGAGERVFRDYG
jgi:hypothetical protein